VAVRFHVSVRTAFKWFHRVKGKRLDRVSWHDAPRGNPRPKNRTPLRIQKSILSARFWLKKHSALGEFGPAAILRYLKEQKLPVLPSQRTVARILAKHGLVRGPRQRQRPPPPGWYLPDLAEGRAELDTFDFIESLAIKNLSPVEVFNGISLCGSLAVSWPRSSFTTSDALACLRAHWRTFGCPSFAQFDNDTRFQGSHQKPGCLGRLVHLCLCLGVVPVFAPPRETGFQAKIESYNNLWQLKVWHRWRHTCLLRLSARSEAFLQAHRSKHAARIASAPPRWPLPNPLPRTPTQPLVMFLRRTSDQGQIRLLDRTVFVDKNWPHRLVRCQIDVLTGQLQIFALRRRQPDWQPMLQATHYEVQITHWYKS
jgi:hypothetical protein